MFIYSEIIFLILEWLVGSIPSNLHEHVVSNKNRPVFARDWNWKYLGIGVLPILRMDVRMHDVVKRALKKC